MSDNPFYQAHFIERPVEAQLHPMLDASPPHNVALVGGFGFGKTYVFNRLCEHMSRPREGQVLLCPVRLAQRPDATDRQGFYSFLDRRLRDALRSDYAGEVNLRDLDSGDADVLLEDIIQICSALCRKNISVVFAFDGFERIASCFGPREQRDLGPLRSLTDDAGVRVRFLIASRARPMHIEQSASMNSKFFTIFTATERVLRPFSREETASFLRRPGAEDIPDDLVDRLYFHSGGILKVLHPMAVWAGRARVEKGSWPTVKELECRVTERDVPEFASIYMQLAEDLKAYQEVGYSEAMCRVALGAPIYDRADELRACCDLGYFTASGDGKFYPVCPIVGDVLRDHARVRLEELWPVIGKLELSLRVLIRARLGSSEKLDYESALRKRHRPRYKELAEELQKDRMRQPVLCANCDVLDYSYLEDLRGILLASAKEFPELLPDRGARDRFNNLIKVVIDVRNPKAHFRELDAVTSQAGREAATKLLALLEAKSVSSSSEGGSR